MTRMFLLFSHTLSEEQKNDAEHTLHVKEFIYLDEGMQTLWSNIPTDTPTLDDTLIPIKNYITENITQNDIVLIQGDFGAVYNIVNFLKKIDIKCVYATTKRVVKAEHIDNKIIKKSIFEHRIFREYM